MPYSSVTAKQGRIGGGNSHSVSTNAATLPRFNTKGDKSSVSPEREYSLTRDSDQGINHRSSAEASSHYGNRSLTKGQQRFSSSKGLRNNMTSNLLSGGGTISQKRNGNVLHAYGTGNAFHQSARGGNMPIAS